MTEYMDIVDEDDKVIGREERDAVHEKHLLHRAVNVIVLNGRNQVLLQLRKASKKQYPLFWCSSAAGHVESGEKPEEGAAREAFEEIGLKARLSFVGKFRVDDRVENEWMSVFFARSDGPFRIDRMEAEKAELFDFVKLMKEKAGMKMTPGCMKALDMVAERVLKS